MANKHGDFVWYELLTPDADAAQRFYGEVVGWQIARGDLSGLDYRVLSAQAAESDASHQIGGIMPLTPAMIDGGARAIWLGYIEVDDVDQAVTRLQNAGGRVLMAAADLPGVGRIALVADPQGALFYLMHSLDAQDSLAFAHDLPRPGHCAWNELTTPDAKASLAFYNAQFGWVKDGQMDQGPNGTYEFLRHGYGLGALNPSPDAAPAQWTYYFRVADFDTAVERIGAGGGQIGMGPVTIPDGDRILHAVDPQGARFALIG